MVTLVDIRGQDRVVELLSRAIVRDRVPHAYLFCGPAGCGKYSTGLALAAALNCESAPGCRSRPSRARPPSLVGETPEPPGLGCQSCEPCEKIAAGVHPDVRTLEREGKAQIIPIETIRKHVVPAMAMPPHEGKVRVFLIREVAALQGPAANALLKTLEEPPPRTHFVLGTTAPDQLLPTIRSRCQRVAFAALPPDVFAELHGDNESGRRLRELVDAMWSAIEADQPGAVLAAAQDVGQERAEVAPALALLAGRLRDSAVALAGENDMYRAALQSRRAALTLNTEIAVTEHNAHGQLSVEDLLYRLRRATP